jgi:hypothetical protein
MNIGFANFMGFSLNSLLSRGRHLVSPHAHLAETTKGGYRPNSGHDCLFGRAGQLEFDWSLAGLATFASAATYGIF